MHINWDLEHELDLHNLLKHWAQNDVSAKQIGESLVNMLYKRDSHLGYRVTKMVDRRESYGTIGNDMLEHYNIRDVRGKPLWDDHCGDSGMPSDVQVSHRSFDSHRVYSSSGSSYSGISQWFFWWFLEQWFLVLWLIAHQRPPQISAILTARAFQDFGVE